MTEATDKIGPRRWTPEEDALLVNLLLTLHMDGRWKAEGGFKCGYLVHLEKLIEKKMPEAGLKSNNIDSRLSYLRKRFNALLEIKNKGSGFGWDDNLKMVTCPRNVFDEWCKSHKDANGMLGKPFPCYDAMEEIYAKDRATGAKGNTPLDRDDQDAIKDTSDTTPIENALQDDPTVEVSTEGSGTSNKRSGDGSSKKPSKKKLRRNKEIQNMQNTFENLMGTMLENNNAQIAQLTTMLEGPKNYKVGLRDELGKVHGIPRGNILELCSIMTESDVAIFRDLTDEDEKYEFLAMILSKA